MTGSLSSSRDASRVHAARPTFQPVSRELAHAAAQRSLGLPHQAPRWHFGDRNPPIPIVTGSQTDEVPDSYRRYLANFYRKALHLVGTPVRIEFKIGSNPFEGKKNPLTKRQIQKRRRLIRHTRR